MSLRSIKMPSIINENQLWISSVLTAGSKSAQEQVYVSTEGLIDWFVSYFLRESSLESFRNISEQKSKAMETSVSNSWITWAFFKLERIMLHPIYLTNAIIILHRLFLRRRVTEGYFKETRNSPYAKNKISCMGPQVGDAWYSDHKKRRNEKGKLTYSATKRNWPLQKL
jgi:hypothetical protein